MMHHLCFSEEHLRPGAGEKEEGAQFYWKECLAADYENDVEIMGWIKDWEIDGNASCYQQLMLSRGRDPFIPEEEYPNPVLFWTNVLF